MMVYVFPSVIKHIGCPPPPVDDDETPMAKKRVRGTPITLRVRTTPDKRFGHFLHKLFLFRDNSGIVDPPSDAAHMLPPIKKRPDSGFYQDVIVSAYCMFHYDAANNCACAVLTQLFGQLRTEPFDLIRIR
jgi:hypothetical protein